jgi:uracil-DNA glycosylase
MWSEVLSDVHKSKNMEELLSFLNEQYKKNIVYPKKEDIFRCFKECSEENLKVIIIGQDPYHEPNQANGLAFSVPDGVDLPPSLLDIYKEIENEYKEPCKKSGDLTYLAKQGVLLLNKYLTVVAHRPLSHKNYLYDELFVEIINSIEEKINRPLVYMLWGSEAQKVSSLIKNKKHIIIKAVHPSPLSANRGGWFNTGIFLKCNEYLVSQQINPINWVNK